MRGIMVLLLGVGLLGAYGWWTKGETQADAATAVTQGFVPVEMPAGAPQGAVLVLAPPNCPSEEARRAEILVRELRRQGITVVEHDSMSFEIVNPTPEQRTGVENAVAVFQAGAPAVFVRGMGMSNPTAAQVVALLRGAKS